MRKLVIGIAAVALLALFAMPAMGDFDVWAPDQTTVPVKVIVEEIAEVYTDTSLVTLTIENCGDNKGGANAVQRNIVYISNVAFQVSAKIDADIQRYTQFHILIDPTDDTWVLMADSGAAKTISWRRDEGGYIAADGGAPNQVSVLGVGIWEAAFSGVAFTNGEAARSSKSMPVQYFADARNFMPDLNVAGQDFNVVWTIAAP